MSILFHSIERSDESHRLIDVTYLTKMRWYKILAQIFLMLSIIDFALTAPVVVQKHSGVDAAKDGKTTYSLWDPSTNALPTPRSSDSGHWKEQEPRQHDLRSRTDSSGSPEPGEPSNSPIANPPSPSPSPSLRLDPGSTSRLPTSQAPTDEPDPLNLGPSSLHGNTYLNPSSGPTDNSDR